MSQYNLGKDIQGKAIDMNVLMINGSPRANGNTYTALNEDLEGLQQMRTLAKNMAFLMKSIKLGKESFGLPESENKIFTNFVR